MTSRLAELAAIVLGPLEQRPDEDWQRAPPGKWTPAQIVEHLAIGIDGSAEKFEERRDRPPMTRRPRRLIERIASVSILGLGWYPQGFKAPEGTVPAAGVSRASAEAHFREGMAKWEALERDLLPRRPRDLFLRHPRLGDLTMPEWIRFHVAHARHHAKQIEQCLAG
jgi:DinB superfamily